METMLFIWLASVIGNISSVLASIAILIFAIIACDIINTGCHNSTYDNKKKYPFQKTWGKWCSFLVIFITVIASVIPSEKTMYLMAGGYAAQSVVTSDTGKKVGKIIESKLDEYLKETEEKLKK